MESSEDSSAMAEPMGPNATPQQATPGWRRFFGGKRSERQQGSEESPYRAKSTLGILSDRQTDEVPGK